MTDIRTVWVDLGADFRIEGPGLEEDEGLQTAVVLSLFSDARAKADDVIPDGTAERRGWWGDAFADRAGDRIGSRLWLLAREKQTPATAQRARDYAREALAWLITDGIAREVIVTAEWLRMSVLGLVIEIRRGTEAPVRFRFDLFWQGSDAS